jgi:environmental stress-induced protein Ves
MIRHLTKYDFKSMPWANGKGVTLELARADQDGAMLWRLSRASVVEDGDFSIFPGVERNLTVITGPGFDLVFQDRTLTAAPLQPVAFAGDDPCRALRVAAPSDDFNVMTARHLPKPLVRVISTPQTLAAAPLLAVYALTTGRIADHDMAAGDLLLADGLTLNHISGLYVAVWFSKIV